MNHRRRHTDLSLKEEMFSSEIADELVRGLMNSSDQISAEAWNKAVEKCARIARKSIDGHFAAEEMLKLKRTVRE